MAVTMWRGLVRDLRAKGTVLVQVRSPASAARLAAAMSAAATEIAEIGFWAVPPEPGRPGSGDWESAEVTGPVPVPGGCVLIIHAGNTPPEMDIGAIPRLLSGHLESAGITEAEVRPAPLMGERYGNLGVLEPVVRTVLCGPPPPAGRREAVLHPELTGIALEWLRAESQPGWEPRALLSGAEVPVSWDMLSPAIAGGLKGLPTVTAVATDFASGAAAIVAGECLGSGVAMAAARAGRPARETAAAMRQARELVRAHARLPRLWLASVTAEPASGNYGAALLLNRLMNWHEDFLHAAWYQLLSPERLRLLGGPPPGAAELPGGRIELTVGEPEQWIAGHPDYHSVRERAARLLAVGR